MFLLARHVKKIADQVRNDKGWSGAMRPWSPCVPAGKLFSPVAQIKDLKAFDARGANCVLNPHKPSKSKASKTFFTRGADWYINT